MLERIRRHLAIAALIYTVISVLCLAAVFLSGGLFWGLITLAMVVQLCYSLWRVDNFTIDCEQLSTDCIGKLEKLRNDLKE